MQRWKRERRRQCERDAVSTALATALLEVTQGAGEVYTVDSAAFANTASPRARDALELGAHLRDGRRVRRRARMARLRRFCQHELRRERPRALR